MIRLIHLNIYLGLCLVISSCAKKIVSLDDPIRKNEVQSDAHHESHQDHHFLSGKWKGEVIVNSSNPLGGGTPTLGEVGADIEIHLFKVNQSLEGTLVIGQDQEQWLFKGSEYIWWNQDIKLFTGEVKLENLPSWIKNRILQIPYEHLALFHFKSCNTLLREQPCMAKKDLPEGIENGYWVFMANGTELQVNVYYTYPSGGQRILEQKLSKR